MCHEQHHLNRLSETGEVVKWKMQDSRDFLSCPPGEYAWDIAPFCKPPAAGNRAPVSPRKTPFVPLVHIDGQPTGN